jgi:hypothetical protein|nr:MAG TPA: hypothetical protein [Inoviridae sp.]
MILQVTGQTAIATSKNHFVDKSTGEVKEYYRATFVDKGDPVVLPVTEDVYNMLSDVLSDENVRLAICDVDFRVRQYRNKIDIRAIRVYCVNPLEH